MQRSNVYVAISVPSTTSVSELERLAEDLEHNINHMLNTDENFDNMRYESFQLDTGTKLC